MKPDYLDILYSVRRNVKPCYYDANGVPRFLGFRPQASISHDRIIALFEVKCQECERSFLVEMSSNEAPEVALSATAQWQYGDPPYHLDEAEKDDFCIGCTMSAGTVACKEFWVGDDFSGGWKMVHPDAVNAVLGLRDETK